MHDSKPPDLSKPSGGMAFGMVQADIFRDRTLSSAVKLVYVALATYADEHRTAFPSQQTLAADTGLSVRSVGKAVRQGVAAGLFAVTHTQSSNRYLLRDLRVGGYALGSGPETPVGTTCRPERHPAPSGSAPGADKQDQISRPPSQTRTSSDAASGAPRTSSPGDDETDIKIFLPRNFATMGDGEAFQHLVACSISALRAVGQEPAADAADRIGRAIKATAQEKPRDEVVELLKSTLRLAGTDHQGWGSLATPRKLTA